MLEKFSRKEPSQLDEPIDAVLHEMETYGPQAPEYPTMLSYLERLKKLKTEESPERINPNSMLTVAGNLLGILVIVAYEQKHVMTSKALGNLIKPK